MSQHLPTTGPIVDLFAGAGGWDEGLKDLGHLATGIELDEFACATARAAGHPRHQADIAALDPLDFYPIDGLIASPPCPSFSSAGKGLGKKDLALVEACALELAAGVDRRTFYLERCADARSLLSVEPLRWALALRPQWIAFEQVPPVLGLWTLFAEILETVGYSATAGVLSAEQYGVPQTRKRAYMVAALNRDARLPEPTHSRYYSRSPERLDEGLEPWVSMAEALGWGMNARPSMTVTGGGSAPPVAEPFGTGARKGMRGAEAEGRWHYRNGNQGHAAARDLDEPAPTIHFGARSNKVEWELRNGKRSHATARSAVAPAPTITGGHDSASRVWTERRPAPTVVTTRRSKDGILIGRQLPKGEGENVGGWGWERPSTNVNCDPRISSPGRDGPETSGSQQANAVRVTQQEAAILMGFRPDYPWQGTKTRQFQQIGNAVCPPMARAVLGMLL